MNKRMLSKATMDQLLGEYIQAALTHGAATKTGEYKKANPAARQLLAAFLEIRGRGPKAQEDFLVLLSEEDPGVRTWAASHALEFAPERAERVLDEIASGPPSPVRLSASLVLRRWRDGTWKFPSR